MSYVKQESIERVKEAADIVEIVRFFCPDLKKTGASYKTKSPFTQEKTASFVVSPAKGIFKDFSSGLGGDAIHFLMEIEKLTFIEAIQWVAKLKGIQLEYDDSDAAKSKVQALQKKDESRSLVDAALKHYQTKLLSLSEDHPAWRELFKRGYSLDQVSTYRIGFAPGGEFLYEKIRAKGTALLTKAREVGLIGESKDKFWNRLVYGLFDKNGLLVGMAGRDLSGKPDSAKWINPIESSLYHKDKIWYGLNWVSKAISKAGIAWIVEGYNDVIALQENGIPAVASCGTSITNNQIDLLGRLCKHVVFAMDGDAAGKKSMIKHIPLFLAAGFRVDVFEIPFGMDPDDFCRWVAAEKRTTFGALYEKDPMELGLTDGFHFLMKEHLKGDDYQKAQGLRELFDLIATIPDTFHQSNYLEWLKKESKLSKKDLDKFYGEAVERRKTDLTEKQEVSMYIIPKAARVNVEDVLESIEKYQLFYGNNQIWMQVGQEPPYAFRSVSNFTVEIIQHMSDQKFPMKLIRVKNVYGQEKIFDVPSDQMNTPLAFDNAVTAHGNYLWSGGRAEFNRLRKFLFERMGVGEKIEVMGWQPQGFWVWNNMVTVPGKGSFEINQNGIFVIDGVYYYVPSANSVYRFNDDKHKSQKRVLLKKSPVTLSEYLAKIKRVHRGHGMNASLFTMATVFLDIILEDLGVFPLFFLFGPPSTGKDNLIEACQSFFGNPQTAINLQSGLSTGKAGIRKMAQMRNGLIHFSEYVNGDKRLDGTLKGFWDRRGYEFGTIESKYGTDEVPILGSVIYTGNNYPEDDAVITRHIAEEMTINNFTKEDDIAYNDLKDTYKQGISSITAELLELRPTFKEQFKLAYRKVINTLKALESLQGIETRIITNVAILGATYECLKDHVMLPFDWNEFISHNLAAIDKQLGKLNTASIPLKWWDSFLACARMQNSPILDGRDFSLEGNELAMRFTLCFTRVAPQWWQQYHEMPPGKRDLSKVLSQHPAFIEIKKSHYFRDGTNSSAFIFNVSKLAIAEELHAAVKYQEYQLQKFKKDVGPPADPSELSDYKRPELPF